MKIVWLLCAVILICSNVQGVEDVSWEWGARSLRECKKAITDTKRQVICHNYREIVEDLFDVMGIQMAQAVESSSFKEVRQRAVTEPWKSAGYKLIDDGIQWILDEEKRLGKMPKVKALQEYFQSKYMGWMLKVTAGDSQGVADYNFQSASVPMDSQGKPEL
eukprot:TRINITY_DN23206_c0_g1_i1.p1 TRINITY_DN23206_c0_g1~~TRINITY_DN23206_c0_g1_i1.p1  ORF type:complete len:162 (-),score=14.78 TRINITY_DN23206_c0_g1_i1:62-547(-)